MWDNVITCTISVQHACSMTGVLGKFRVGQWNGQRDCISMPLLVSSSLLATPSPVRLSLHALHSLGSQAVGGDPPSKLMQLLYIDGAGDFAFVQEHPRCCWWCSSRRCRFAT